MTHNYYKNIFLDSTIFHEYETSLKFQIFNKIVISYNHALQTLYIHIFSTFIIILEITKPDKLQEN